VNRSSAGLLQATPRPLTPGPAPAGVHPLAPAASRAGLLVVPATYRPATPAPLVVLLHGAGGDAGAIAALLDPFRRALGSAILVVPESRAGTWDAVSSALGPDAEGLDAALTAVFQRYAVDAGRVAIAGFSDGASYALTLGLANGGLFRQVLAFSPGSEAAPTRRGTPRIFVSHGTHDPVLPVERTSRRIVPRLASQGYAVLYREFDGGHAVPEEVQALAARWLGWSAPARAAVP
jgi:predicted esterase